MVWLLSFKLKIQLAHDVISLCELLPSNGEVSFQIEKAFNLEAKM